MTALHRTLSLSAVLFVTGCSSAPEPTDASPQPEQPVEVQASAPMGEPAPAPMGESVSAPVTVPSESVQSEQVEQMSVESAVETTPEPSFEPAPVGVSETPEASEVTVVGEVEIAGVESVPAEVTVDFLQRLHDQIRRDIRHDRMDRARERFATVRGRLTFDSRDPRAGIAGDVERIGGFLDHVADPVGGSKGGQPSGGTGSKPVK